MFGAVGYLVSPLRLAGGECGQLLYFKGRGLRMGIGHMLSLGSSTPVTVAGAAVVKLAESLFLSILRRTLWGDSSLSIGGFGVVLDMQSAHSMGGRPELAPIKAVLGQIARFYGLRSHGGGALTDAKLPSVQAGMQKAMLASAGIYSCGSAAVDAGLLSLDEIYSPEQMVYDVELVRAMGHSLRSVEVTADACAFEDIAAVGPGGNFVGSDLTAKRFREELWQPRVWDRRSLQDWRSSGGRSESQRAKNAIRDILAAPSDEPLISEECERRVKAIIARAVSANAGT